MEARRFRLLALAGALVLFTGASYRTPNFIVQTPDPQFAEQVGKASEKFRRELAILWTGKAMPDWAQPCPMTVRVGPNLGAGGATTFLFDRGEVYGWRMSIQGSPERLLDSVLPHEITHMIFASHFRCPLPRWADEGGATSVEHASERAKHHRMLAQFLRSGRGIAFSQMFAMTEYPPDVMPLYAQGFALAEYLIMQGGRRKYLEYVGEGLQTRNWTAATQHHYGFRDLGVLQNTWLAWVAQGFPNVAPKTPESKPQVQLASAKQRLPRPVSNLIYHVNGTARAPATAAETAVAAADEPAAQGKMVPVVRPGQAIKPEGTILPQTRPAQPSTSSAASAVADSASANPPSQVMPASGWYPAGTRPFNAAIACAATAMEPIRTQVTHPQPIERPRQLILQ